MKERLKQLRKALGLTQQEFADKLGISRGSYANYEIGRNEPLDAVRVLICKEYGVNEKWLRDGEGEMFRQYNSREAEIWAWFGDVMKDDPEDLRRSFIEMLVTLSSEELKVLAQAAKILANKKADD